VGHAALPPVVHPEGTVRIDDESGGQAVRSLAEPPESQACLLPFGGEEAGLGFRRFREGPDSLPSAFVVDADGSFWVDDRWKRRVAHYSASGEYLGQAGPLQSAGWDLAVHDGTVFVLVEQMTGLFGRVQDGVVLHTGLTYRGQPLFAFQLVTTPLGLVAQAGQIPGSSPGDLGSFVLLELPRPQATRVLPGLPIGRGDRFLDVTPTNPPVHPDGDQDFDLTFSSAEIAQIQPVQIELDAADGGRSRSVPAEVGLTEPLVMGEDVLFLVKVAPTRPADAERYGGGRWLLRVGPSALLWERLPYPASLDELQHRHLALGPDGSIYLMVVQRGGELILRRPGGT